MDATLIALRHALCGQIGLLYAGPVPACVDDLTPRQLRRPTGDPCNGSDIARCHACDRPVDVKVRPDGSVYLESPLVYSGRGRLRADA